MRAKRWVIASPDTERVRVLSRETGYTPLTAAVLSARGIDTPQAAADYLSCDVRGLHDPFGLTDMDKAVEVVREVIDRGEKMVITTWTASRQRAHWWIICAARAQNVNITFPTV